MEAEPWEAAGDPERGQPPLTETSAHDPGKSSPAAGAGWLPISIFPHSALCMIILTPSPPALGQRTQVNLQLETRTRTNMHPFCQPQYFTAHGGVISLGSISASWYDTTFNHVN